MNEKHLYFLSINCVFVSFVYFSIGFLSFWLVLEIFVLYVYMFVCVCLIVHMHVCTLCICD